VSDTGQGMDEETARRAFDPFFTTKAIGKGTGLGLATVYGIAKQSGGDAMIVTAPGEGTTVSVALPISLEELCSEQLFDDELPSPAGDETILVVEDDEAVSRLVMRVLSKNGYRVWVAGTGAEALELWKTHPGEIDLVLTDVVMPIMGGAELVQRLRELGGKPRVLFFSGYTNNALAALEGMEGELDLLEKPFSAGELSGRVRLALDRP
jgi:two-component system cell cycle sensor histidine kinase/response regulator CckA